MRRRAFLGSVSAALVAGPVSTARAQPAVAPRRIGYIHPLTLGRGGVLLLPSLQKRWLELGYVEDETILLRTAAGDASRLPDLARELAGLGAGVLIVVGLPAARAALAAVPGLPVVAIDLETDPVKAGFIDSWARPGRSLTGLFLDQISLTGKWVALLREVMPGLRRLAIVWDPNTPVDQLEAARAAAAAAAFEIQTLELSRPEQFEGAFARLGPETGVLMLGSPALTSAPALFASAALTHGLPSISLWKPIARAGGLLAYGPALEQYFPRAVTMADAILRGTRPGDIPIERPDRFDLVVNLKTAARLGIAMPPSIQAAADETIE